MRDFHAAKVDGDASAAFRLMETEPFREAAGLRNAGLLRLVSGGSHTRLIAATPATTAPGNLIAIAYATSIATNYGLPLDFTRKLNVAKHTGATSLTRFVRRPDWDTSEVRTGARYILVDDVMTSGVSLAEMRSQVLAAGGMVCGVTTLAFTAITDKDRAKIMSPFNLALRPATVRELSRRFGDDAMTDFFTRYRIYGGEWRAMTEGEAWLLRHYRSVSDFEAATKVATQASTENPDNHGAPVPVPVPVPVPPVSSVEPIQANSAQVFSFWRERISSITTNDSVELPKATESARKTRVI